MSEEKTRIVQLAAGQVRERAENERTLIALVNKVHTCLSFRDLFVANYAEIRRECTASSQPGLCVIAIHAWRRTLAASLYLAAKVDVANAAIIGRHGNADLYLSDDVGMSLRHLAIILSPLASSPGDLRYRIVDLRTGTAFQDEHGERFEALEIEGPMFVRCGDYAVFCLPTGDATAWPARAVDGWACIPERVYLRGEMAEPDRWQRQLMARDKSVARRAMAEEDDGPWGGRGHVTEVSAIAGPERARAKLVSPGEQPLGVLRIQASSSLQTLAIGPRTAKQGILLGRYDRCDVDGINILTHENISRVHLLIIDIEGRLYAVDTASTNGMWLGNAHRVRVAPLGHGSEIRIGESLATLRWNQAQ